MATKTEEAETEEKVEDDPKPEEPTPEPEDKTDWKAEARKHERRSKQAQKRIEEIEAKLAKIDDANKTEQEKALDAARKEAAEETRTELQNEVRAERLSAAIARQAADKFADIDDAIRLLDTDNADLFNDEGQLQNEALTDALNDLLERKPHLGKKDAPIGESDAGKGAASSPEDMSVEDHLKAIQQHTFN